MKRTEGNIKMKRIALLFAACFYTAGMPAKADIVNPYASYHYEVLKQDLKEMKKQYEFMHFTSIGKTSFGRKIYGVKLGKGKHNILLVGSHHGREWLTSALTMKMMEYYAQEYKELKDIGGYSTEIFDEVSIWFIPMLNPDGVVLQQDGIHSFPKRWHKRLLKMNEHQYDFKSWKANGIGIDLNRQYPSGWNDLETGKDEPCSQFYKGKKPIEAAEIKALIQFVKRTRPEIAVAYHSSGQEIFWDYHNGSHLERDRSIAEKISDITGYPLSEPSSEAVGGGFKDWFITEFHKPAMTIEICKLIEESAPPIGDFPEEWERNQQVGILLAAEAQKMIKREIHSHKK